MRSINVTWLLNISVIFTVGATFIFSTKVQAENCLKVTKTGSVKIAGLNKKGKCGRRGLLLKEIVNGSGISALGPMGPQGPAGTDGAQGPKGDPGSTGTEGAQGPEGASPFQLTGLDAFYNDGFLGLGTANPDARLHVLGSENVSKIVVGNTDETKTSSIRYEGGAFGSGKAEMWYNGSTNAFTIKAIPNSSELRLYGRDNGGITIYANGDIEADSDASKPGGGSWTVSSDARLKKNIKPLSGALSKLLALEGVTYEYLDPKAINELEGEQRGFVAQQVQTVFPEWVDRDGKGYLRVSVKGFEALVVEALREIDKEHDQELAELKDEIEALKTSLSKLQ